ncbi:MAG: hypothetical protein HOV80_35095, partial [Polyangiaceae bacterium]|nr:hypothetical protein [Polyangiaceae bacterium]
MTELERHAALGVRAVAQEEQLAAAPVDVAGDRGEDGYGRALDLALVTAQREHLYGSA